MINYMGFKVTHYEHLIAELLINAVLSKAILMNYVTSRLFAMRTKENNTDWLLAFFIFSGEISVYFSKSEALQE